MNIIKLFMIFILATFSCHALAYGGGGSSSKKACKKPKFSQFMPPHLSVVDAESEFSFLASATTLPKTITVKVKKQPVDVSINKINNGYTVSGKLPDSLKGTFARIEINATGSNKCKGNDGWLLNINE